MRKEREMVYLIHFERHFHHARHYIGYSENDNVRLERHRQGNGARLLKAVSLAGIGYEIVRVWPEGDRAFERHIHRRKNSPKLCPLCRKEVRNHAEV